jgi:hypothetical protein
MYANHMGKFWCFFILMSLVVNRPNQGRLKGVLLKPQAAALGFCLNATLNTYLIVHTVHMDDTAAFMKCVSTGHKIHYIYKS